MTTSPAGRFSSDGDVSRRGGRIIGVVHQYKRQARSPLDIFSALIKRGLSPAFLYSGEGFGQAGRYSILALDRADRFCAAVEDAGDPLVALREAFSRWSWSGGNDKPSVPFVGGWVGYLSYDLLHRIERVTSSRIADHGFPLIDFAFYRTALVYDHQDETWTGCGVVQSERDRPRVSDRLKELLTLVSQMGPAFGGDGPVLSGGLISNFTQDAYESAVRRALAYISAGDVYQVNLSQRFEGRSAIGSGELALRLFRTSPAPFSAYVPTDNRAIVSSSPERFLHVRGRDVQTWPIKGTRPRGATAAEDARLVAELRDSDKERAELTMITDLLRNDLGRVCEYGSVKVADARVFVSYRNVHHTYSRVTGRLRPGLDVVDLLRATFPGGSVTGVPKIRAMEIIEELEPTARGPYCGSIGYVGVDGAADLNIAIRTVLCERQRLTFQVGGGIVADSDPSAEYQETVDKARGIMTALGVHV